MRAGYRACVIDTAYTYAAIGNCKTGMTRRIKLLFVGCRAHLNRGATFFFFIAFYWRCERERTRSAN